MDPNDENEPRDTAPIEPKSAGWFRQVLDCVFDPAPNAVEKENEVERRCVACKQIGGSCPYCPI